jgi:hypothetical protein
MLITLRFIYFNFMKIELLIFFIFDFLHLPYLLLACLNYIIKRLLTPFLRKNPQK